MEFSSELTGSILSSDFSTDSICKCKVNIDLSPLKLNPIDSKQVAFVLENALTSLESKSLIEIAERTGFCKALVNQGGVDVLNDELRSSSRLIIDAEDFVENLWARIGSYFPKKLKGASLVGLNERLRILRYQKGEKFAPHSDGTYARPENPLEVSLMTIQIYLNEGFDGGETTFLREVDGDGLVGDLEPESVKVVPRTGMILAFDQDLFHEGSLLKAGVKYTIRTDVMYSYCKPD